MTNEQIRQLTIMRREGAGYGTIADALHLSINTVKSWCRRHHLPDGTSMRELRQAHHAGSRPQA